MPATDWMKILTSLIPDLWRTGVIHAQWAIYAKVLSIVFVTCVVVDYYTSWKRLSHIKGPFWGVHSKYWLVRTQWGGRMDKYFGEVCEKYGKVVRVGPNHLLISDPFVWKQIIKVRSPYKRSDWYLAMRFDPTKDNVESERDDKKHSALRSKMSAGYSGKEVGRLEETIDRNISALVQLISKYVPQGSDFHPMDFGYKVQYFTLDVISDVSYGKAFGYLANDADLYGYIKATETVVAGLTVAALFPWLNTLLQTKFMQKYLPSDKDDHGFGKISGITKKFVSERFGPNKVEGTDMLASFVRHGLSQEEAESETILQVLAGSDTTSTAIRATFLHIITNTRVLTKLRAEITEAHISSPITDAEARELPYLQAIIKEGLRIHAPVVGLASKEVPEEGDTICGQFIPGGTHVGFCAPAAWKSKEIWGEDAEVFRPERWIDGDAAKIKENKSVLEVVFGVGKWQCLGQNIALMELNKVLVELLRRFEFALIDPTNPWKSECYGLYVQSQMWLSVSKRESI